MLGREEWWGGEGEQASWKDRKRRIHQENKKFVHFPPKKEKQREKRRNGLGKDRIKGKPRRSDGGKEGHLILDVNLFFFCSHAKR